jgi:CMP/dCMP kinase
MTAKIVIALDGPAGSGKSTVARALSFKLHFKHVDSGAIYRTLTLFGLQRFGPNLAGWEPDIAAFFSSQPDQLRISYQSGIQVMWLQNQDVSKAIREERVTQRVKYVSDHPACREVVNRIIHHLADLYPVVIDGRDIGTKVFPDTPFKFYLDAQPVVRAARRARELGLPTTGAAFEKLLADIRRRDSEDMARAIAPLCQAEDAVRLDTSDLTVEDVVVLIREKLKAAGFDPDQSGAAERSDQSWLNRS